MKIYGYSISHEFGVTAVTATTKAGALDKLAAWCLEYWPPEKDLPEGTKALVDEYFDENVEEGADAFEDDLALDVNDLREAYCAEIDAGHTLDGDHDWINEQMQALNDALPSEWYVHSSAELADLVNPLALPKYLAGIDDFPRLA